MKKNVGNLLPVPIRGGEKRLSSDIVFIWSHILGNVYEGVTMSCVGLCFGNLMEHLLFEVVAGLNLPLKSRAIRG
jgi:hypothetical protein